MYSSCHSIDCGRGDAKEIYDYVASIGQFYPQGKIGWLELFASDQVGWGTSFEVYKIVRTYIITNRKNLFPFSDRLKNTKDINL